MRSLPESYRNALDIFAIFACLAIILLMTFTSCQWMAGHPEAEKALEEVAVDVVEEVAKEVAK